jgi:hypothetical protein
MSERKMISREGFPDKPACVDCDEERGTCPAGRCRDCDLEHVATLMTCRSCHRMICNPDICGPRHLQHAEGCDLAFDENYGPRDAAEYRGLRADVFGTKLRAV